MVSADSVQGALTLVTVFGVLLFLDLVGRAVARGEATADLALPAGWGMASLAMTLPGVLFGLPLYYPVMALVPLAGFAVVRGHARYGAARGLLKVLVAAGGLLAVVAGMRVHPVDTFTYWLPNALYLHDHNIFPVDGIPSLSWFPGFPQNLQLISYIAGLLWPYFPSTALIAANVLLLLWFAALLARAARGAGEGAISWQLAAFAVLAATLLNPTFVPSLALSSMGDLPTGILLAACGQGAVRILAKKRDGAVIGTADFLALGLALAALINIKESNPALVGILLIACAIVAALDRRTRGPWPWRHLAAVALPPALVYAAWRYEVNVPLAGTTVHELIPLAKWQFGNIPAILKQMAYVATLKGGYFGLMLLLLGRAVWVLARGRQDIAAKLVLVTALVFIGYTAFLVLVYIALFTGKEGLDVQSFWRFNTQLGPLALLAATGIVTPHWRRLVGRLPAAGAVALVVVALGAPFVFIHSLRVDRHGEQPRIWAIGKDLVKILPANARLDIVLPGDNGDLAELMAGVLTQTHPRRTDLHVALRQAPEKVAAGGLVWLSCASSGTDQAFGIAAKPGAALLLRRQPAGWRVVHRWPDGACVGAARAARVRRRFACLDAALHVPLSPGAPQSRASLKAKAGYLKYGLARAWCKLKDYD